MRVRRPLFDSSRPSDDKDDDMKLSYSWLTSPPSRSTVCSFSRTKVARLQRSKGRRQNKKRMHEKERGGRCHWLAVSARSGKVRRWTRVFAMVVSLERSLMGSGLASSLSRSARYFFISARLEKCSVGLAGVFAWGGRSVTGVQEEKRRREGRAYHGSGRVTAYHLYPALEVQAREDCVW